MFPNIEEERRGLKKEKKTSLLYSIVSLFCKKPISNTLPLIIGFVPYLQAVS